MPSMPDSSKRALLLIVRRDLLLGRRQHGLGRYAWMLQLANLSGPSSSTKILLVPNLKSPQSTSTYHTKILLSTFDATFDVKEQGLLVDVFPVSSSIGWPKVTKTGREIPKDTSHARHLRSLVGLVLQCSFTAVIRCLSKKRQVVSDYTK